MPTPIEKLVRIASLQVGVREVGGNNRGLRVEEYQQATWLNPGPWPWCAALTCWLLREWLQDAEVRESLDLKDSIAAERWRCRDASAFGWEKWAQSRGLTVLGENEPARAGDLVVFDFSHIGIVTADQGRRSSIETIEGNTNGQGTRDSEVGDGVWYKKRKRELVKSYLRIYA